MNVDNQHILYKKPGFLPAKDVIEFLMAKKPNAIGWAVQEANGDPLDILQQSGIEQTVDDVVGFLEGAKDNHVMMYFAKLIEGHHPEDVQPIVISDDNDKPFLAIFCEGNLLGHNADKVHTEHYNFVNGVLLPQIIEICEDFDGDIDKVMAKLRKDSFSNTTLMHADSRLAVSLLPFKGEPLMVAKNELHKPFDWGWMSHAVGYGVKKEEPVKAAASGSKRSFGKARSTVRETVAEATKANADKPTLSVKPSVPASPTKSEDKPISETIYVRPPSWLHSNNDIRAFYEILTGAIPSNWKKKIPCTPTQNHDLLKCANYDDFKQYRLKGLLATTGGSQTKQERMTSTATPGVVNPPKLPEQQPDQPIHGPVDPTPMPIIEADKLQKVLDLVATLDHNSKVMMDPKELQKIEADLPKFTEQVGLKGIEETMNWKVSDLFAIAATDPRAIVLFALQWRSYGRQYLIAELKNKAKTDQPTTVETTRTQLTPNTVKTESVVRPARKWGKKAA